jgi:hypothetical protein
MIEKGLVSVVRHRQGDEQRSSEYDKLMGAEAKAIAEAKGVHSGKEFPLGRIIDASEVCSFRLLAGLVADLCHLFSPATVGSKGGTLPFVIQARWSHHRCRRFRRCWIPLQSSLALVHLFTCHSYLSALDLHPQTGR